MKTLTITLLFIFSLHAKIMHKSTILPENSLTTPTSASFLKFYNTVNTLINTKKWKELNKYAHPDYGFYIYDNPGVRPLPTNYRQFDNLIDSEGKPDEVIVRKIAKLKADKRNRLKSGKVPVWDCGTERWNKRGSFCQDISFSPDLQEHVLYSGCCDENPNHPKVVQAKQFSKFIRKHVVQTSGYEMYFALIKGKWYIAVIDLCDKCSA